MKLERRLAAVLLTACIATGALAQTAPEWQYFRPDNTGVAGDYHDVIVPDRSGNVWTNGYMPFWEQGSVARFNGTTWTDWGSYESYLPSARVTGVAFSKKGYLWVAAEGGLARYNGQTWTKYTSANTPLPAGHLIMGIAVDKHDKVWVTYGDNQNYTYGYASFDGATWNIQNGNPSTWLPLNNSLATVDGIAVDSNDNKWIPTSQGLLRINAAGSWSLVGAGQGRASDWAGHVEVDPLTNRVWCSSETGLDYWNGSSWTTLATSWPAGFRPVRFGVRGSRMIVGEDAAYTALTSTNGGGTWTQHAIPGMLSGACVDTAGTFWAVGAGFVSRLDASGWKNFTRYNTGLAEYSGEDLFVDKKNRKWFANGNGGIQNFSCPNWQAYGPRNEDHFPSPQQLSTVGSSVTEDPLGNIWMTYDGVLGYAVKIDGGNYSNAAAYHLYSNANVDPNFQAIEEVEATTGGKVFFRSAYNRIFIHDLAASSWTSVQNPSGQNPTPRCMTPGPAGSLYVGGYEKIEVYSSGSWSLIDLSPLGSGTGYVNDIAFDAAGDLWAGTDAGLWRRSGAAWTHYTRASHNIAADHVATVECGNGKVYAGAFNVTSWPYYGGISIFDGSSWSNLLEGSSGLPHKQVEDLQLDTLGNLWIMAQTEGIAVYRPGGVAGFGCIDRRLDTLSGSGGNPTVLVPSAAGDAIRISGHPNPFSLQTTLSFALQRAGDVRIALYDLQGREMREVFGGRLAEGPHQIAIDRDGLAAGMYFCELSAAGGTAKLKLLVR